MLKVAVAGASGYTGCELLRLLALHPYVKVVAVTSEKSSGKPITQLFPGLSGFYDLTLEPLSSEIVAGEADLVFTALPHGTSIEAVSEFVKMGKMVVDLSADFRLKDPLVYEEWYGVKHTATPLLEGAVYGLPELYRSRIKGASLIANPGCYPTASILGIAPLIKNRLYNGGKIIIDAKSAISGAGRSPSLAFHFPEANEGMEAYKVGTHRHTPEIEQVLSDVAGSTVTACFVPHLIPANRGLLSTCYVPSDFSGGLSDIVSLYMEFYKGEPFVRVLDAGRQPNIREVRGANFCDIGIALDKRNGCIIVTSAIDNLVKGASGAAVQNMNLMKGYEETTGLMHPGLFP
ncbi:MAG: N-acetyl-gamma-glutamyl-phosphate reductase [Nitrospirae bacterium]|nr:N-acetyl-gamma-glutamyl-phosphate reductase [Nitrospirota bacterium]